MEEASSFHLCGRCCWGPPVPWLISISCTWTQRPPASRAALPEASLAVRASMLQPQGNWYSQEQPEPVEEGSWSPPLGRGAQRCVLCLPPGFFRRVKPQLSTVITGLITGPWMAPLCLLHFPSHLLLPGLMTCFISCLSICFLGTPNQEISLEQSLAQYPRYLLKSSYIKLKCFCGGKNWDRWMAGGREEGAVYEAASFLGLLRNTPSCNIFILHPIMHTVIVCVCICITLKNDV